jgi:hypothetical protein
MGLDKILKKKIAFLRRYNKPRNVDTAISMAIAASVQHNSLYDKNISPPGKNYIREQTIDVYESDIESLKLNMNKKFAELFLKTPHPKYNYDPGFRISHSQKSISVYLKHLWCMDLIHKPPQCPVDAKILKIAGCKYPDTKWGYVNSIEVHRKKILLLQEKAGDTNQHISEWELMQFAT